jgi:hypothetical protein
LHQIYSSCDLPLRPVHRIPGPPADVRDQGQPVVNAAPCTAGMAARDYGSSIGFGRNQPLVFRV